jgi:uncharacterized protein YndB with AHSA1/START domain
MAESKFVYVTYIRTTPEKLWEALLKPEFTRQYWFGVTLESGWEAGSPWRMALEDGRVADAGEVLEVDPPRRLVLRWEHELHPELKAEGPARCTIEIEATKDVSKLTIVHEIERENSKLIEAVSGGWPRILSNLKSLLETGRVLSSEK